MDIPNLIELQKSSFKQFIQSEAAPNERQDTGLQGVFKSSFPIKDFNQTASLEFVSYHLDEPKYEVAECRNRGMTFASPVKLIVRLILWDTNEQTGVQSIRDVKEQEVYFGEVPLMTENGTFIINGTERVIVSQLHRSPGIFFEHDKGKTHASGKLLYSARVIPYRGSWLDFEFDAKDILYVRIDRRRKLPVTVLLRALGFSAEDLLNYFYKGETFSWDGKKIWKNFVPELLIHQKASNDIKDPSTGDVVIKKGRKFTRVAIEKLKNGKLTEVPVELEDMIGRVVARDVVDPATGEIILGVNEPLTPDKLEKIRGLKVASIELLYIDELNIGGYLRNTLLVDKVNSPEEAIIEVYKRLRPGDPVTIETATRFFENLFFNPELYDLSKVGRLKINYKFGFDVPLEAGTLRKEDVLAVVRYLLDLKDGTGEVDDIDHLGNRRVRPVGELLENQFRDGLARMERSIRERMSLQEVDTLMPHDLVNAKPVMAVVKEFFSSSQLSQFMDQTNPLSEITHKRRLSALGPGGLTRDRAGFEVRDVHFTHYGRICPIETPEGPNIGLIASLSAHARVNEFGFIETPYRKVAGGRVSDDVVYCSALEEEKYVIAQANAQLTPKGEFATEMVQCRKKGEFILARAEDVQMMDVSPNQLVSIAAALVPFLENDDANRALMGSNMERQAVPLIRAASPLLGTTMEAVVARDSGVAAVARRDGTILSVDATKIVVKPDKTRAQPEKKKKKGADMDVYQLIKYQRSNQNTCINQTPIVSPGEKVKVGDIIADGTATELGELALGQNMLVAFMPWGGYNFEDSILISERVVKDDSFTSIHIEEFECVARDTKLGKEDITRDIPNVAEEALANLDESGTICIGAEVKPGDILVGKITPKGETQLSPEEKLLRAIFGEKAGDVKDSSLRVPPGIAGIVIGAQVFSREGIDLESEEVSADEETAKLRKELEAELKTIRETGAKRLKGLLIGKTSSSKVMADDEETVLLPSGKKITESVFEKIPISKWGEISVSGGEETEEEIAEILEGLEEQEDLIKMMYDQKITKLKKGDELPPGVIKIVKIYVAIKRKLQVGDKMAGRHGNKGVISRILPEEDMPYLADGRPVDIVVNPLGVPSRMNVGQILECHLGWAARALGEQLQKLFDDYNRDAMAKAIKKLYKSETMDGFLDKASDGQVKQLARSLKNGIYMDSPVFDGARESEIKECLKLAGLPEDGQTILFDGRTGEPFSQPVTVGVMYIMKLHHLVEDKIHARSIGPYSLVTQQPLGGKAQFGGQRLGEMEVWAMEAYGASNTLQEFLTVKSDDVIGRTRMYEAIVKGDLNLEAGLPESFNVMIKELQALCLDAELIETK